MQKKVADESFENVGWSEEHRNAEKSGTELDKSLGSAPYLQSIPST